MPSQAWGTQSTFALVLHVPTGAAPESTDSSPQSSRASQREFPVSVLLPLFNPDPAGPCPESAINDSAELVYATSAVRHQTS